jgi:hypothetical protein
MLHHAAVQFARKFKFLGRVSESRIESFHYTFKLLFNHQHRNSTLNPPERLRRSLADAVLKAIKPFALKPASGLSDAETATSWLRSGLQAA